MAEPDITVRTADATDACDIAELGARTFLRAYAADNKQENIEAYVAESFSRGAVERDLRDPHSAYLLVVRDNRNIGYAKIGKGEAPDCVDGPDPIELERIYVDADHQGRGIGATLMQAVIDYAKSQGHGTIWLGVWEMNAGARKFYEKHGFRAAGRKYFMVGDDRQNDVVMRRLLD